MIAHLSDGRRALQRALADQLVAALARVPDPTGCWAANASNVG